MMTFMNNLICFWNPYKMVLKNAVKESNTKRRNVNHLGSSKKIEKAFRQEKQAMKLSKFLPTGLNWARLQ